MDNLDSKEEDREEVTEDVEESRQGEEETTKLHSSREEEAEEGEEESLGVGESREEGGTEELDRKDQAPATSNFRRNLSNSTKAISSSSLR